MRDAVGTIIVVALIIFGVLGFVFILANRDVNPKPSEVFTTECAQRGGSAKTSEGWSDGLYVKDYKCEVPQ